MGSRLDFQETPSKPEGDSSQNPSVKWPVDLKKRRLFPLPRGERMTIPKRRAPQNLFERPRAGVNQ